MEGKELLLSAVAIDADSKTPVFRQLYDFIRKLILRNAISPGTRLPSTRRLSLELGVSRNTVISAFELLETEGFIKMEVGRGSYVLDIPMIRVRDSKRIKKSYSTAFNSQDYAPRSKEIAQSMPFALGLPAVDAFPLDVWRKVSSRSSRRLTAYDLEYGDPYGLSSLRCEISEYLATYRGVECTPQQVLVVSSAQMAIHLITQVLIRQGHSVWLEDPGYLGAREALELREANIISVPVDGHGLNVSEGKRRAPNACMAYVTPSHQFPLGPVMSVNRRLELLQWADEQNAWILEDDYDSEFRYTGQPISSLQGLDSNDRVIYVGTFAKTMFPSLRLAYLVVPHLLIDRFYDARVSIDGHQSIVSQTIMSAFMSEGHFSVHIRNMRDLYEAQQKHLLDCINQQKLPLAFSAAPAGMHLVGLLNDSIRDVDVENAALQKGIHVPALSKYYLRESPKNGLLVGYTGCTPSQIKSAVDQLPIIFGTMRG